MLNLNYNIIGSIGPRVDRQGAIYQVRLDPYSSSLVLAMPGNLFVDGDYQNQFGMNNPWDDISAYVKAGPNGNPVGSNLEILVSQSLTGPSLINTSSLTVWGGSERYNQSVYMNGANALVVNETFAAEQGVNLSFNSSFVMETWAAFEQTASASETDFRPNRIFAWKYNPGDPTNSSYIWYGNWGGDIDSGGGVQLVSGSTNFIYDFTQPTAPTTGEVEVVGTTGSIIIPLQWKHYAVSYNSASYSELDPSHRLNVYINGNLQGVATIPADRALGIDTSELMQVMGSVDASWTEGAYSGSAVYWQDFRLYNGTTKNYTGSLIPLPESMVTWA